MSDLREGDSVEWSTAQGLTHGKVVEKLTEDEQRDDIGKNGMKVKASEEEPKFVVESDKTGAHAAHKAEALNKIK